MGRGACQRKSTHKEVCALRLSGEEREMLRNLGDGKGITKGFAKMYEFYVKYEGLEQSMNMDRGVIAWTQNSIRTPVQEGLRDKFLAIVDLWINSDCEDLMILNIYAAIGRSKGNGAAAKKALKQLVDSRFVLMGANSKFRPNIRMVEGVSQDEFDIQFDRYKSLITQEL